MTNDCIPLLSPMYFDKPNFPAKVPAVLNMATPVCTATGACSKEILRRSAIQLSSPSIQTTKPAAPWTEEATVKVQYTVVVGGPIEGGEFGIQREFTFTEMLPSSIASTTQDIEQDTDILSKEVNAVINRHHNCLLLSQPWACANCSKQATAMLHKPSSHLIPKQFNVTHCQFTRLYNTRPRHSCLQGRNRMCKQSLIAGPRIS